MAYRTTPRFEGDLRASPDTCLVDEARQRLAQGTGLPRELAAEILRRVAAAGESGSVVAAFDAATIKHAVARIASNYDGWEE